MKKNEIAQHISELWNYLNDEQREVFVDNLEVVDYQRNDTLFDVGEAPTHLMYLYEGKVKLVKTGIGDKQHIVRLLTPGMLFSFRAQFAHEDYGCKAIAMEPSVVARIPGQVIDGFIRQNPQVAMVFIRQLSSMLGKSVQKTVDLTQKHLRGRLADTLLKLKNVFGEDADGMIDVLLSREDYANLSNMTTSNAIRTLSSFVDEGLIKAEKKKIGIVREADLLKISSRG
jgi:CRP-like cAMP-binding protein